MDDRSKILKAGTQSITTPEDYVLLLDFENGLPYLPIRPFTDNEWRELPHVAFTSDIDWDPSQVDCNVSNDVAWFDAVSDDPGNEHYFDTYDEFGDHHAAIAVDVHVFRSSIINETQVAATRTTPASRTYGKYRDYFLRASPDVINRLVFSEILVGLH